MNPRWRGPPGIRLGIVDGWPIKIVFEFTAMCNLHCFMCGFETFREELRDQGRTRFTLPVETFRVIAEKAFPHISIVNPTVSGEPLVLPYWDELIEACEKYDCKLELISNGMLVRGDRLHKMMPVLGSLTISFDGATKEIFEYVRTGANFEQVMENIEGFARLRRELGVVDSVPFQFNVTLLRENVHELPQIVDIAAANDVDLVTVCYMVVGHEGVKGSSPMNCPEETNRALEAAKLRAEELGVELRLPAPLPANARDLIKVEQFDDPIGEAVIEGTEVSALAPSPGSPALERQPEPVEATPEAPAEPLAESAPAPAVTEAKSCETRFCGTTTEPPIDLESTRLGAEVPPGWGGKYFCDMAWRTVFVGQAGEITPCCSPTRPLFGNGFEDDFLEVWNGPKYQELREGLYSGNLTSYCQACPYLKEAGLLDYQDSAEN